ncbi:unnamed protein product, partial [Rotaria sp. Silwood1]
LTIYVTRIDVRSVLQYSINQLVSEDDQSSLIHNSVSSYRHRFEHSTNFQSLRWSLRKLKNDELCEFCDLMVPVVS